MVGFGVSYKFLSSFNVWSRGTNTFSKAHHCANTNVGNNWVFHVDRLDQADKISVDKKQKCKSTFSPRTVRSTVTNYTPLTMEKKKFKMDRKENWFTWTVYNTGTQFSFADNSDFGLEYKTVDLKNINKRLGQKY